MCALLLVSSLQGFSQVELNWHIFEKGALGWHDTTLVWASFEHKDFLIHEVEGDLREEIFVIGSVMGGSCVSIARETVPENPITSHN